MLLLISFLSLRSPTVVDLTKETFFSFTSHDQRISVVHFYGKNCPACVDAEETFEELSRMYWQEPRVRFGQLDCDRYTDVCDSTGAADRPAWLAWMPGQTHSKRYNRNINEEQFEKWIRQQTGIWPTAKPNNLLYINSSTLKTMIKKKINCVYTILDTPRMEESQQLHNASRTLEKKVKKGARFFATDIRESPDIAKKLFKDQNEEPKFGAFLYNKGTWSRYKGENDPESIAAFFKEKKCNLVIATPTPTPIPLEELEDVPDDEYIPFDDQENAEKEKKDHNEEHNQEENDNGNEEEHQNSENSDWSDDEM